MAIANVFAVAEAREMPRLAKLAIVVPTRNERDNVPLLVERLGKVLAGIDWEVTFADDASPDGTADVVHGLAQRDPRVHCLQRVRRSLAAACIEGIRSSSAPYIAVMVTTLPEEPADEAAIKLA